MRRAKVRYIIRASIGTVLQEVEDDAELKGLFKCSWFETTRAEWCASCSYGWRFRKTEGNELEGGYFLSSDRK